MAAGVLKLEDIIKSKDASFLSEKKASRNSRLSKKKDKKIKEKELKIPKGTPVSGRKWKSQKNRFTSIIKTRGHKNANKFEKLQVLKKEINRVRNLSKEIVQERKRHIEEYKERRKRNIEKKEKNRLKAEIVQVIKNSAKIRRAKKKQLRNIKKRDTVNM